MYNSNPCIVLASRCALRHYVSASFCLRQVEVLYSESLNGHVFQCALANEV